MPQITWATDGSERGPCAEGFRYYGNKPGCSCHDCRPTSSAARALVAQATPAPANPKPTSNRKAKIVYTLPSGYETDEPWDQFRSYARAQGWTGPGETWRVWVDRTTGDELDRDRVGTFTL